MDPLQNITSENLHHAVFLEGDKEELKKYVLSFIKDTFKIETTGNPDIQNEEHETLGVEAARNLKERASKRSLGGKQFFIISLMFGTTEAQNALLKLFEEPGPDTYFFLIAPSSAFLLPTLSSRLHIFKEKEGRDGINATVFLKASTNTRLKIVEPFKDAENESKKSSLLALISEIEKTLSKHIEKKGVAETLRELLKMKQYLFDRAPSTKMISEYLALTLPQIDQKN